MKYLIPPSEGKSKVTSKETLFADTNFRFGKHVDDVVRLFSLIEDEDLSSVYGTSEEKAMIFHRQNQDIFNSKCAYAIERYTGVVYEHLNWESLNKSSQDFLDTNLHRADITLLMTDTTLERADTTLKRADTTRP